ncbi:hypothetical protein BHE74_00039524 [Ensete ventricosum]|nr:hypothetical protein BHE74_00039524 [Ensete ventricosum]
MVVALFLFPLVARKRWTTNRPPVVVANRPSAATLSLFVFFLDRGPPVSRKSESPCRGDVLSYRQRYRFLSDLDVCPFRLLKYCLRDILGGLPGRVLSFEDGEWKDFAENIISLVQEDFRLKKAITEAYFKNQHFLLDFIHMVYIDLKTGLQKPIAWIDVDGKCFFPEVCPENYGLSGYHHYGKGKQVHMFCDPNGTHELDAHLEISVSAAESSSSGSDDEVMSNVKRIKKEENPLCDQGNETVGENGPCPFLPSYTSALESWQEKKVRPAGDLRVSAVQDLLLQSLGQVIDAKDILRILKTPAKNDLGMVRFSLFQEQATITQKIRGNANVRYAWLSSSKDAVEEVMSKGILRKPIQKPAFGNGIHLAPANCSNIW